MPFIAVVIVFAAALFFTTVKVLNEYERGVMFTLGRFTGINEGETSTSRFAYHVFILYH